MKKALITGISGQDGSYLAEFLLSKGYAVHGTVLPVELTDQEKYLCRLKDVRDQIHLYPLEIEDYQRVNETIKLVLPDESYHLAASSFVSYSFDEEFSVFNTNLDGTHYLLASLKEHAPGCKFYFAGSSEMFGNAEKSPQDESTPFHPRSPYGITKTAGFHLTRYYREHHGLFVCNGIAYNHESPRRGIEYVTQKITHSAVMIKRGKMKELRLGNLDAQRDWGYAPDYVRAMWLMLQQNTPQDFVLATGKLHSVRDICKIAFSYLGLNYQDYVRVDPEYFRPESNTPLVGDASKAGQKLAWSPQKEFEEMILEMVKYDLKKNKS